MRAPYARLPLIALAALFLLAACGQKGPLTLPDGGETGSPSTEGEGTAEQPARDEEEDS
ncbi:MAG TPA: lipoprotein [Gammaproteobacteria bacterium]|nr:lipoprotein [Gammaproteobacteria bacterium]